MGFSDWYSNTYKPGGLGNGREVDWGAYNDQNKDVGEFFSKNMATDEGRQQLTNWGIDVNSKDADKQFAAYHFANEGQKENRALPMFPVNFPGGESHGKSFTVPAADWTATGNKASGGNAGTSPLEPNDKPPATTTKLNAPNWYQAGLSGDWSGVLSGRPDVAQEYKDESTRDKKSISNLNRIGATSDQAYAQWWWNQYGRNEWSAPPEAQTPTGATPPSDTVNYTPTTPTTPATTAPAIDPAALQAEKLRIQNAAATYDQLTAALRRNANTASYYNADDLANLEDDIRTLRERLSAEKPLYDLTFDASPYTSRLDEAAAALSSRRGQRASALSREDEALSALLDQLSSIPEWDADSVNSLIAQLDRRRSSLDRFTGDLTPQTDALSSAYAKATDRLRGITSTRSQIERDAQALIDRLKLASPQNQADYDALAAAYDDLRNRTNNWRASNASDELTSAADLLGRRKSDLQALIDKLAANQRAEAARINVDASGNSTFGRRVVRDPVTLTPSQMAALRRRNTRQNASFSSFARNMGL